MLNTILNASYCAGCIFILGIVVLSSVLVARLKEPRAGGLEWLVPFEAVLLYGISNAVGNLSANLSYRLAIEHGWGNPGMFPLLGRVVASFHWISPMKKVPVNTSGDIGTR